ncbi:uncharacterized protein N7479_002917 [Penicillium vulpinum]|uniref:Uncharacterized protein n=1 Tax=Penicillium vulpinum TaxID=29845 RepID=A0A1V6RT31_9EURO|nr:uncharacterized protein N7479_002917 [Penicillium vulpinum]KAJ5972999.1 hypothetical protein N7479_002917 [Penicillium vulpinum]OQE04786.1 hypothetical protein PENVUL_c030G06792 [Penicillium vulpinum]
MKKETPEEKETYKASLFEPIYGKEWKTVISSMFEKDSAAASSSIGAPQLGENGHAVESDAGNGEDIIHVHTEPFDAARGEEEIDTSHIGVEQRELNVNTEWSDAEKEEGMPDTYHACILWPEGSVNTGQSDAGKGDDIGTRTEH